jgi:light-regulated signal transduction histidine kinase (bacteriophytochrome)
VLGSSCSGNLSRQILPGGRTASACIGFRILRKIRSESLPTCAASVQRNIEVEMMRDLRAAIRNQPPAEHDYDWAPIHMPGSVQAYGVLLVVDPQTRRVQFVSENAAEMLGVSAADIIDKSYVQLADSERERKFLKEKIAPETILFPNPVRLTIKGRAFDAVFHAHAGTHLIEIEPADEDGASYDEMSMRAAEDLYDPPSVDDLYQRAVRVVREVSGFDRVMLYRFDARYNGQVIAENQKDGIGSFLGLFFPSADIGARSREMYLHNFTRYIPDISGKTFPLKGIFPGGGHFDTGHPVDMSHANLRSVYPCHVTYLRNIGVQASMSFSINVDGRLWGLFACHHYAPRRVSYEQRVVCEQTAMMFIYRLASMSSTAARLAARQAGLAKLRSSISVGAALRRRLASLGRDWRGSGDEATASAMVARAMAAVQAEAGVLVPIDASSAQADGAALTEQQKLLLELVEADSAAIVHHGLVHRIGDAPSSMAIYAITSMFGRELPEIRTGDLHVYATDSLSVVVPAAEEIKDRAAGIMAASLSPDTPSYLLWFRREQIVHATWAGNPVADALAAGTTSDNPRASFEAWKQDIRNLSRPWVLEDVEVANELATLLREVELPAEPAPKAPRAAAPWSAPSAPPARESRSMAAAPAHAGDGPADAKPPRGVIRIGQR